MKESHIHLVTEPAYLRELRATGRVQSVHTAMAQYEARQREGEDEDDLEEEVDEEALAKKRAEEELRRLQEEELAAKIKRERPPELLELVEQLKGYQKKIFKYEKR